MSWSKWSICKGNRCQSCVSLWECVCVSLHCLTLLTSYLTSIRVLSRLVNDALWGPQWRFCFFPAFTTLPLSLAQPHRLPVQTQYFSFGSLCLCVSHLVRNTDSFIITTAFSTDSSFIDPLVKDVMEPGHNSRGVCVCGGGVPSVCAQSEEATVCISTPLLLQLLLSRRRSELSSRPLQSFFRPRGSKKASLRFCSDYGVGHMFCRGWVDRFWQSPDCLHRFHCEKV